MMKTFILLSWVVSTYAAEWKIIDSGNCEDVSSELLHSFSNEDACVEAVKTYSNQFSNYGTPIKETTADSPPGCILYSGGSGNELRINADLLSTKKSDNTYDNARHCTAGQAEPFKPAKKCLCIKAGICPNKDGQLINSDACMCGTSACTAAIGLFCFEEYNQCGRSRVKFIKLESGRCGSITGRNDIIISPEEYTAGTKTVCTEAGTAVGITTTAAPSIGKASGKPAGCTYDPQTNRLFQNAPSVSNTPECTALNNCICFLSPPCLVTDGQLPNSDTCMCGTTPCTGTTGLYCYLPQQQCDKQKNVGWLAKCNYDEGLEPNTKSCSCMNDECNVNKAPNDAVCTILSGERTGKCSCAAGWYANNAGVCVACPAGTYQDEHSQIASNELTGCDVCKLGTYVTTEANAACLDCARGKYNDDDGKTKEAHNTDNGNVWTVGTCSDTTQKTETDCTRAQEVWTIGTCSDTTQKTETDCTSANSCKVCVTGQTSDIGKSFCFTCALGKAYLATAAAEEACSVCPAGKRSVDLVCRSCEVGFYQNKEETGFCLPCIPGKYQPSTESISCEECPIDTYTDVIEQTECQDCETGKTSITGSAVCVPCPGGKFSTPCQDCNRGQYRSGSDLSDLSKCEFCEPGRYTSDKGNPACGPCVPGKYLDDKRRDQIAAWNNEGEEKDEEEYECRSCPAGFKSVDTGSKKCVECNVGEDSEIGSAKCNSCEDGKFTNVKGGLCKNCGVGRFRARDNNATKCRACPAGWHGPLVLYVEGDVLPEGKAVGDVKQGLSSCKTCPVGTYLNEEGMGLCKQCLSGTYNDKEKEDDKCKNCPINKYGKETEDKKGATSEAQCESCPDDRTTGDMEGAKSIESCLCKKEDALRALNPKGYYKSSKDTCTPCPPGADCSHHNDIVLKELVAKEGFWRSDENSTYFIACNISYKGTKQEKNNLANDRCCPIGKCLINQTKNSSGADKQCKDGYKGLLCKVCNIDYVLISGECKSCPGGASFSAAFYTLCAISFVLFLSVIVALQCCTGSKKDVGERSFGQIKIVISFIQVVCAMPNVFDNVPWPEEFLTITFPFTVFNFDLMGLFAPAQCTLAVRYFDQFILAMVMPGLFFVAVIAAWLIFLPCNRKNKEKRASRKELMYQILILIVLCCYPGLATQLFTMFRCKTIEGAIGSQSVEVLDVDWDFICYQGEHLYYANIAITFIVLYIIGWPTFMVILLWRNRAHLHDEESVDNPGIRASLGGLYLQYEPEYWYFELVVMIQKMLMTGALCIVSPGTSLQILTATLIMLFYMLLLLKTAPYEEDSEDWSSFVGTLCITLTTIGGFALITDNDADPTYGGKSLTYMLVALNISALSLEIIIILLMDCGYYDKYMLGRKTRRDRTARSRNAVMRLRMMSEIRNSTEGKDGKTDKGGSKGRQGWAGAKKGTKVLPAPAPPVTKPPPGFDFNGDINNLTRDELVAQLTKLKRENGELQSMLLC